MNWQNIVDLLVFKGKLKWCLTLEKRIQYLTTYYSVLFIIIQHELFITDSYLMCKQSLIYR